MTVRVDRAEPLQFQLCGLLVGSYRSVPKFLPIMVDIRAEPQRISTR